MTTNALFNMAEVTAVLETTISPETISVPETMPAAEKTWALETAVATDATSMPETTTVPEVTTNSKTNLITAAASIPKTTTPLEATATALGTAALKATKYLDLVKRYEEMPKTPSRNLVKIRPIRDLTPCPGSRVMHIAHIDEWLVVVKGSLFSKGQLVVYVEIDSFLPADREPFTKLISQSTYKGQKGFIVKSTMFGVQLTQGKVFALDSIPVVKEIAHALATKHGFRNVAEFPDITEYGFADVLGVFKWEPSIIQPGRLKGAPPKDTFLGARPAFIKETGASRVQNCPNLFTKRKYWAKEYQESIKMDGESMTVYFVRKDSPFYKSCNKLAKLPAPNQEFESGRFGVCSHRKELNDTANSNFWALARKYDLPSQLAQLNANIAIQGELCGWDIRGNRENLPKGHYEFFVFDVYDLVLKTYRLPGEVEDIAEELGLPHVPVAGYRKIPNIAKCHQDLLDRAKATKREGLVFKCGDGRRFKVINDDWLLEHGE